MFSTHGQFTSSNVRAVDLQYDNKHIKTSRLHKYRNVLDYYTVHHFLNNY